MESVYIAMWSGPRNISTALMRSFDSRSDAVVVDEPFYGHYLRESGKAHPMAREITASMDCDQDSICRRLRETLPQGKSLSYQKHMAHHLLPSMDRAWMQGMRHAFLIREPRAMLASLNAKLDGVQLEDTGLPQQVQLFEELRQGTDAVPPVVDSSDLLADPGPMLLSLCRGLLIPFSDQMLTWEPGARSTDGIWGCHWYGNTNRSTGFSPAQRQAPVSLPTELESLAGKCQDLYSHLAEHRLRPS